MTELRPQNTTKENIIPIHSIREEFAVDVLIKEATELVAFSKRYIKPTDALPGLLDAGKRFSEEALEQTVSLIESLKSVQHKYLELAPPPKIPSSLITDGRRLHKELAAFVSWYEETEEENIHLLQSISRLEAANTNDLDSPHALAYVLYNYATVSKDILTINGPAGGIDSEMTEQAFLLARDLIEVGHNRTRISEDVLRLASMRKRLSCMLQKRIGKLNSTIRFVFRHYPAVLQEIRGAAPHPSTLTSFQSYRGNPKFIMRHASSAAAPRPRITDIAKST